PKAPTNLKTKKKRISPSSKPKSPYKVRVILPKKQVTETQHAEVTVATANITKNLVASELAEEQVLDKNIVEEDDVGVYSMEEPTFEQDEGSQRSTSDDNVIDITPKDDKERDASDSNLRSMPSDDLASLTDFETPDSDDETSISVTKEHSADNLNVTSDGDVALPYAFAGVSALSDPFGRLQRELTTIYSKVDQMESQFTKRVSDELKSYVPSLIANTLKEQLHGMKEVCNKLSACTSTVATHSQYVQDLMIMFYDMVSLLEVVEVFKKANAEGKKREKNNQKTPKDTEVQQTDDQESATLKAQAQKWIEHEAKKAKIIEEYNHLISFRADQMPIIKIIYVVNPNKEATMKITIGDNPLNLINLRAKFQWVINQSKKLGLPPPSALATFGMIDEDKKGKGQILEEVFMKENVVVNGMHRNLVPPSRLKSEKGLSSRNLSLRFSSTMGIETWSCKEKKNYIWLPQLI
nr:hypothetical protein [Tanacetum cinerariifolium]